MNRAKKDGVSSSVLNLSISPTSAKHANHMRGQLWRIHYNNFLELASARGHHTPPTSSSSTLTLAFFLCAQIV